MLLNTQQFQPNILLRNPVSESVVDRFRAMLTDKEDRLNSTDEIVRIFKILLSSLILNSKQIITDLTIIAGEQRVHCKGIANAICDRIIEVPVDRKLPSLYLLDSIVKNMGKEYMQHFSARLPEVFYDTYVQVNPKMQRAMRHLFGTWKTVFSPLVLHEIEAQLLFSPSLDDQSLTKNHLRASQSPTHMDAKCHYRIATVNTIVAESASSSGRAAPNTSSLDALEKWLPATDILPKYASPYRNGRGCPSLSSHDIVDIKFSVKDLPSRGPTDNKTSRVVVKEETDEGQAWDRDLKSSNVDLRGPRALISRLIVKEETKEGQVRDRDLNSGNVDLQGPRALISEYGIDEREKSLKRKHQQSDANSANHKIRMTWQNIEEEEFDWEASRKRCSENCSSIQPPGSLTVRHELTTAYAAPLVSDYGENHSMAPSSIVDKISHANAVHVSFNSTVGVLPNVAGAAGCTRESHQLATNYAAKNIVNPRPNQPFHPKHNFESSRSNLLHIPSNRFPGTVPLPLQSPAQVSQMQPNPSMPSEIRTPVMLPSIPPVPSHQMMPRPPYGYGTTSSTLVPPMRPSWQNINAPNISFMNIHGPVPAFPSIIRGPNPGHTQTLNITHTSTLANPQPTGALSGLVSSLVAQGLISQGSGGLEFDTDSLKVRHKSVVAALFTDLPRQCTTCGLRFKFQEEHSKHMDWHVTKNRNLRIRNAKSSKPSPKWFVSVDLWLAGVVAVESAPAFLSVENDIEYNADDEMAVIANDDQNTCALCGEPFDNFFCDEMEAWMYKGAVYMDAPGDSSQLGSIVHGKCRSDSNGNKSMILQ